MAENRDGQGSERFSILKVFQRTTKVANAEAGPIARRMADDIYTEPLGTASSIRVLYLQKRSRGFTQLRALLKVVSLDKFNLASSYFAVSYA
jgi:predicted acylesterase/phospholipase RssA